MTEIIKPGPDSIDPATAPGGVVLHVYSVPDVRLVLVQYLTPGADIEGLAVAGADAVDEATDAAEVCLVAYDGDTGLRLSIAAAMRDLP